MTIAFGAVGTKSAGATTATQAIAYPASVGAGDLVICGRSGMAEHDHVHSRGGMVGRSGRDRRHGHGRRRPHEPSSRGLPRSGRRRNRQRHIRRRRHDLGLGRSDGPVYEGFREIVGCSGRRRSQQRHVLECEPGRRRNLRVIDAAVGDMIVAIVSVDTDVALTITSPFMTIGGSGALTLTRRTSGAGVGSGNDGNVEIFDHLVTAGEAETGTCALAFTTATVQAGAAVFMRLREVTVTLPTPVAAYHFDEGSGLSAADVAPGTAYNLTAAHTTNSWTNATPKDGAASLHNTGASGGAAGAVQANTSLTDWSFDCYVRREGTWSGYAAAFGASAGSWYIEMTSADSYLFNFYGGTNSNGSSVTATLNQWYHVCVTRDSGGTLLYVDGVVQGSKLANAAHNFNPSHIAAGMITGENATFNGAIDNLRIFGSVLTPAQVTLAKNTPVVPAGQTISLTQPAEAELAQPIAEQKRVTIGQVVESEVAQPITIPGPPPAAMAAYNFDSGTTSLPISTSITDQSGNGNHLIVSTAAMPLVTGKNGANAVKGNGSTRAVVSSASAVKPTTAVTLMVWLRRTANFTAWGPIVGRATDSASHYGQAFAFYTNPGSSTGISAPVETDAGFANPSTADTASLNLTLNTWEHFALTWDAATDLIKVYKGGSQIYSGALAGTGLYYAAGTKRFNLLANDQTPGDVVEAAVEVDDVRVFDTALDAATITSLMNTPVTAPAGQTIPIGQVVESETPQPITARKVEAAAQTAEVELAQPIAEQKRVTVAQRIETELAQPITVRKIETVAQVVEVEVAQAIARVTHWPSPLGQPSEVEAAQPITPKTVRLVAVAQLVEVEAAQPVTSRKVETAGQPIETETAQPIGSRKFETAAQPSETETAQPVTVRKIEALGQTVESEQAQPVSVTGPQLHPVASTLEIEAAQPISARKVEATGQPVEVEAAQPVTTRKFETVGSAGETESAQPVTTRKIETAAQIVEVEAAQSVVPRRILGAAQSLETELAQPISVRKVEAVGQAAETETAGLISVGGVRYFGLGQTSESEAAQPVTVRKTETAAQTIETEQTQQIRPARARTLTPPVEVETAQPITYRRVVRLGQVIESETAQPVGTSGITNIGLAQAVEVESVAADQTAADPAVGQPVEVELAQPITVRKIIRPAQVVEVERRSCYAVAG